MRREEIIIYPAAGLFNARECKFNVQLVNKLENLGYKTKFPQRDGFEFGNLNSALKEKLPEKEISSAVENIIYYLDMGKFIPESHVIVANLDEPQDEGVLVELCHGKQLGKYNIGFRTDVRSPYGTNEDSFGGMHFFPPLYSCDAFIQHYMPCKTMNDSNNETNSLVEKIDKEIMENNNVLSLQSGLYRYNDFRNIIKIAEILFDGIDVLHSQKGPEEITKRYCDNQKLIQSNSPKIIK